MDLCVVINSDCNFISGPPITEQPYENPSFEAFQNCLDASSLTVQVTLLLKRYLLLKIHSYFRKSGQLRLKFLSF